MPITHNLAEAISIHTLRVEGDVLANLIVAVIAVFQSTPSAWRATCCTRPIYVESANISIHTLRVEGDHMYEENRTIVEIFQSTPSVWRATSQSFKSGTRNCHFNPHPPCGGRQLPLYALLFLVSDFNPHPPCGGRRYLL